MLDIQIQIPETGYDKPFMFYIDQRLTQNKGASEKGVCLRFIAI